MSPKSRAAMCGSAARTSHIAPLRFVDRTVSQPSSVISSTVSGTASPELFTSTSSEPKRSTQWLTDRKSTRLNSSHANISYAVFCLKKKNVKTTHFPSTPCNLLSSSRLYLVLLHSHPRYNH